MTDIAVQLFDGTPLSFPQGTADAVIDRVVKQETFARKAAATNANPAKFASAEDAAMASPTSGNSFLENARIGAGKAFSDIGRGIKQLATPETPSLSGLVTGDNRNGIQKTIDESRKLDAPLMNTGGGIMGNIAGNIAATLPTMAIPGVNSMVGGAALGGVLGGAQPVASGESRLSNAGLGAIGGAAIPAIGAAWRTGKSLIEPFYEGGRAQILGRALQESSGGDAQLLSKLQNAKELVPGSLPTVAEAANNPSIAGLQRSAFASTPEVKNAVVARNAQQNTARVGELLDLSGNQGQRDMAESVRELMSDEFFKQARLKGIDPAVSKAMQPQIDNLMERMPSGVVEKAKELARIKGETMGPEGSVSGLHWIKKGVDEMIGSAGQQGIGPTMKAALTQFKSDLLKTVEELSPDYMKGSRNFATFSKPLNEMDTAAEIAKRSINGINDRLTPAAYARALRDETAQKATGFKGATLENTLSPNATNRLQAIRDDLQRADFAANSGRSGSDTVEKLAYNNILSQAGVPNFLRAFAPTQLLGNVASIGANVAYGSANKTLQKQLANALLDPKEAAQLLQAAKGNPRLAEALMQAQRLAIPAGSAMALESR